MTVPTETQVPDNPHKLRLRQLRPQDFEDVRTIWQEVYKGLGGLFRLTRDKYRQQIARFPEGQLCIEDKGRVVAVALAMIVDYQNFGDEHTYAEITDNCTLSTHDPNGDVLYGVDVFIHPDYRGMRLGRRLYDARKELCRKFNLKAIIAGGRIPNYHQYADSLSPEEYIEKVGNKELYDPVLSFQLSNDFKVGKILTGYLPEDNESAGYATLLKWINYDFQARERPLVGGVKTNVRVGAVQWQMRRVESLDDLLQQVEYFIDALADYQADFALLPEFFNVPLMGEFPLDTPTAEAMRLLASEFTPPVCEAIARMAVHYNINIIAGSLPQMDEGEMYNVAYLFRRDGTWETQYKLHITPTEHRLWNMRGGHHLRVFNTDAGKIGILICYDCEFPELGRLLMDQGLQILFIPFWTETKNGYQRVRYCAQARAIENECYVVMSGSVGNLPRLDNVNIQYAQSAVLTPSDFSFPHDATLAETTPNTEMLLITDLELDKLKRLRHQGGVRNYKDRRHDLYRVEWIENDHAEES
ncbi:bifunctional GNAT family N-acetyltransferase/carbon-nitrogen hydrolase family protein [Pseudaeromonas sp. ZJS20]|uniref:GNAT family N-acetyltransferase n=1 Tax=Pseudaeromonas aegiceratis TaxID=3153928 RepID=UPI00390C7A36